MNSMKVNGEIKNNKDKNKRRIIKLTNRQNRQKQQNPKVYEKETMVGLFLIL